MKQIFILPALMMLAACGGQESDTPAEAVTEAEAPAAAAAEASGAGEPLNEAEVKEFAESFESAMQAVPPELRADFQEYLTCEIEANNARPAEQQIQIDAAHVRSMTAKLKADPSLANC